MSIKISFKAQNKIIRFEIEDKVVRYFDDIWQKGIQLYPMQPEVVKKMINSRFPKISAAGLLIADANLEKNLEEYKSCNSEEDLAEMIRKDCLSKGLLEIKNG